MNPDEVVRVLRDEYGIGSAEELDRKIRELTFDVSVFCNKATKEEMTA